MNQNGAVKRSYGRRRPNRVRVLSLSTPRIGKTSNPATGMMDQSVPIWPAENPLILHNSGKSTGMAMACIQNVNCPM